ELEPARGIGEDVQRAHQGHRAALFEVEVFQLDVPQFPATLRGGQQHGEGGVLLVGDGRDRIHYHCEAYCHGASRVRANPREYNTTPGAALAGSWRKAVLLLVRQGLTDREVCMAGTGMEGAAAPQGGTTLLVIDDNPALQHAVRCLPAGEQLHCVLAADSIEGLCCIVEHRPSVVLLDSEVAPLDAWRFALLVKEHPDYRH